MRPVYDVRVYCTSMVITFSHPVESLPDRRRTPGPYIGQHISCLVQFHIHIDRVPLEAQGWLTFKFPPIVYMYVHARLTQTQTQTQQCTSYACPWSSRWRVQGLRRRGQVRNVHVVALAVCPAGICRQVRGVLSDSLCKVCSIVTVASSPTRRLLARSSVFFLF